MSNRNNKLTPPKIHKRQERYSTPLILIVCEGENTEPEYFEALKSNNVLPNTFDYQIIPGNQKTSADQIIKRTLKIKEQRKEKRSITSYTQIWAVFDTENDINNQAKINKAFKLAKENNIEIALSNPCIEIWFLCHLNNGNSTSSVTSRGALRKIQRKFPNYDKSKNSFDQIRNLVTNKEKIELAKENAKLINDFQQQDKPTFLEYDIRRNPSTSINRLIVKIQDSDS